VAFEDDGVVDNKVVTELRKSKIGTVLGDGTIAHSSKAVINLPKPESKVTQYFGVILNNNIRADIEENWCVSKDVKAALELSDSGDEVLYLTGDTDDEVKEDLKLQLVNRRDQNLPEGFSRVFHDNWSSSVSVYKEPLALTFKVAFDHADKPGKAIRCVSFKIEDVPDELHLRIGDIDLTEECSQWYRWRRQNNPDDVILCDGRMYNKPNATITYMNEKDYNKFRGRILTHIRNRDGYDKTYKKKVRQITRNQVFQLAQSFGNCLSWYLNDQSDTYGCVLKTSTRTTGSAVNQIVKMVLLARRLFSGWPSHRRKFFVQLSNQYGFPDLLRTAWPAAKQRKIKLRNVSEDDLKALAWSICWMK